MDAATATVRALPGGFGVEVWGLDLSRPTAGTARVVQDLVRVHRLVVVRNQALDDAAQRLVAASMGIPVAAAADRSSRPRAQVRHLLEGPDRPRTDADRYDDQWHADLSWCREGARALTFLHALDAEPGAPSTALADMVRAYDDLDETAKATIGSWRAFHHVARSREVRHGAVGERRPRVATRVRRRLGSAMTGVGRGVRAIVVSHPRHETRSPTGVPPPGALHPVVQTDPSGRTFIHLGDHAWCLEGIDEELGRTLVDDLNRRIVTCDNLYRHDWKPGDLLVWDNRSVLHRREVPTDPQARRTLRRCMTWV